jgi:hypothetical protein
MYLDVQVQVQDEEQTTDPDLPIWARMIPPKRLKHQAWISRRFVLTPAEPDRLRCSSMAPRLQHGRWPRVAAM